MSCDNYPTKKDVEDFALNAKVVNEFTTATGELTPSSASDGKQKITLAEIWRQANEKSITEAFLYDYAWEPWVVGETSKKGSIYLYRWLNGHGVFLVANAAIVMGESPDFSVFSIARGHVCASDFGVHASNDAVKNRDAMITAIRYMKSAGGGTLIIDTSFSINGSISESQLNNAVISGNGHAITQIGDASVNTIYLAECKNIKIESLSLIGAGAGAAEPSALTGSGVLITDSDGVTVTGCNISNQSVNGIMIPYSDNVTVSDNAIAGTGYNADICVGYASPKESDPGINSIAIANNRCVTSTALFGVAVFGHGRDVRVQNNETKGHNSYGIMIYRRDDFGDRLWDNVVVSGNFVDDVRDNSTGYKSGMGIYVQTAKKASITNNIVTNVLVDREDKDIPNRTLPPAAISVNNVYSSVVSGNIIENSEIDGINVTMPQSYGERACVISSNQISDCRFNGIYVTDAKAVSINGNNVAGTSERLGTGIQALNTTTISTDDIAINNNYVSYGFESGISASSSDPASFVDNVSITSNTVKDVSANYITISGGRNHAVTSNKLIAESYSQNLSTSYAILVSGGAENVSISSNVIAGSAEVSHGRGIALSATTGALILCNIVRDIGDIYYTISAPSSANTNVNIYGNLTDRTKLPWFGAHTVGNDVAVDTVTTITYGSVSELPDLNRADGSKHWNDNPAAGGFIGWVKVSGAWKGFGLIEA